jgi:hypothetical protein
MDKLPFSEEKIENVSIGTFSSEAKNENESIRIFNSDTSEESLTWHRDREDRIVESIGETDWQIQLDNQLPSSLNQKVFIQKGVWHRVLKGTGDLKIKLIKLKIE